MTDPIKVNPNQAARRAYGAQGADPQKDASGIDFTEKLAEAQGLRFSNHAQKRLHTRNIQLSDDGLERLANAVEKAEKRGGKESLVLVDDMAFIVNVKDKLVVTAMDDQHRGEGVFTQIDSVVFADKSNLNSAGEDPSQGKRISKSA